MSKLNITVVILTYNEEMHISRCINSIKDISTEVIVIDSFSCDRTVDIAKDLGARVFQNPWKNHATQFNWALDNVNIDTDWVLRLDADEYLENPLRLVEQVERLTEDISGVYINRKYFFMGKWVKHGSMYPISHLRLWKNGHGRVEDRWMDERTVLTQGKSFHIDVNIVDDNLNALSWWIEKHNGYSTKEMLDSINLKYHFMSSENMIDNSAGKQASTKRFFKDKVYSKLPLFIRPAFYFVYRYIFKLGFMDGKTGFIFHFLQGFWYRMLVDFKIYEVELKLREQKDAEKIKSILREHTSLDI